MRFQRISYRQDADATRRRLQNRGFSVYSKLRSEFLKLRRRSLGLRRWMRGRTRQGEPGDPKEEVRRQKDEVPPGLSRFLIHNSSLILKIYANPLRSF